MRLVKAGLKLSVGILLVAALIWFVGWKDILNAFLQIDPAVFLPVGLLYVSILLMTGFSLWFFFPKIRLHQMVKMSLISWSLGVMTPAKLGHLSILYYLKKEGVRVTEGVAAFTVDRMIGLLVSFALFMTGMLLFFPGKALYYYFLLFIALAAPALFFLFHPKGREWSRRMVFGRFITYIEGFTDELRRIIRHGVKPMIFSTAVKLLMNLASVWVFMSLFGSLGHAVPFWLVVFVFSANTFVNLIPITMDGLGLRESVAVLLYSQAGVGATEVVTVHLIVRFLNYAFAAAIFVIFWDEAAALRHALPGFLKRSNT